MTESKIKSGLNYKIIPKKQLSPHASNVTKGRFNEQRCIEFLNLMGYETWSPPRTRFQSQDIFGVGDIIAIRLEGEHIIDRIQDHECIVAHPLLHQRYKIKNKHKLSQKLNPENILTPTIMIQAKSNQSNFSTAKKMIREFLENKTDHNINYWVVYPNRIGEWEVWVRSGIQDEEDSRIIIRKIPKTDQ